MANEEIIIENDEIDLIALWKVLWRGKFIVIAITFVFSVASVLYALSLPDIYKADVVLYPNALRTDSLGGGSQTGGLSGLAGLAGMSIGSKSSSKTDFSLAVLESRKFITEFISNHDILVPLFVVKEWNKDTETDVWRSNMYDFDSNKWLSDPETNESIQPTELEAYERFRQSLSIEKDFETGVIEVSLEFYSPVKAKLWLEHLIADLNHEIRDKDVIQAEKSKLYLEGQLDKTNVVDIKNIFFGLIEDQVQNILLAETKEDYVFEIIDPPVVEENRSRPNRGLICIIGAFLGGLFSLVVVFIRHLWESAAR